MKSLLTNPWFQLAGLLAVVSGGISAYNEAATGAYSGTPRLPDTTAIQPSATPPTGPGDPSTAVYAPQLGVDLAAMTKTASGLLYRDLTLGTGTLADSTTWVTVDWTGWLPDGSRFGANPGSRLDGIRPGRGSLIAGFDEGILGMKAGGKRQLVIPASLGYGATGNSEVPPNSVLVVELQLVSAVPDAKSAAAVPAAPPDSGSAASAPLAAPGTRSADGTFTFDTRNFRGKGWGYIKSLAVSSDGRSLATTYTRGRKLVVWETATGLVTNVATLPDDSARAVMTRDGRPFAIIGGVAEVRLYDGLNGKHLRTLPVPEPPYRFSGGEVRKVELLEQYLAPDDRTLVFASDRGAIVRWDITTGQSRLVWVHGRPYQMTGIGRPHYAITPDGLRAAALLDTIAGVAGGTAPIEYYDLAAGTKLGEVAQPASPYGYVRGMAFNPDGRSLLFTKGDSLLYRWDIQANSMTVAATFPRQSAGWTARLSPDGAVFATPMWPYRPAFLIRLNTRAVLTPPDWETNSSTPGGLVAFEFLPDSRRLAVVYDESIRIHPVQ